MGLFKTSRKDIEKYKREVNTDKLIKALSSLFADTRMAALNALKELDLERTFEKISKTIIKIADPKLHEAFGEMVKNRQDAFMKAFTKQMAENILSLQKEDNEQDRKIILSHIERYKQYLYEFKDSSLPLIIELLNHNDTAVRVRAAEMLKEIGDEGSKTRWEHILKEEKPVLDVLEKRLQFTYYKLNYEKDIREIPLVEIQCSTAKTSLFLSNKTSGYMLGLTDEYIHIVPGVMAPGTEGISYKLPLAFVTGIERSGVLFDIHCESKVLDPNPGSHKTTTLHFTIGGVILKQEPKVDKLIELVSVLKNQKMNKAEIFEKYYDEKNLWG